MQTQQKTALSTAMRLNLTKMNGITAKMAALSGILFCASALAHDMWITPSLDGDTINASVGYGHDFPTRGSEPGRRGYFQLPVLITHQGKQTLTASDQDYFYTSQQAKTPGLYLLSVQMQPTFWSHTADGWKPQDRTSGAAISRCQLSHKFAKSLFQLGQPASHASPASDFARPVGQTLEIIPQTPPLRADDKPLILQVRYQGKPLPAALITLDSAQPQHPHQHQHQPQHPHQHKHPHKHPPARASESHPHHHSQYQASTGQNGQASFPHIGAGHWIARVNYTQPYPDLSRCDNTVYAASFTFERQPK